MIFKDLLERADITKAVLYMRSHGMEDDVEEELQIILYTEFANRLLEIEPICSEGKVLLGYMVADTVVNEISEPFADISVFHMDEVRAGMEQVNRLCTLGNPEDYTDEELEEIMSGDIRDLVRGYAFDFTEWKEILGWEVDPDNVAEVGEDAFVGYVLYEMSFNGMYEGEQQERRDELEKTMQEVEEIMALPPEEREGRFVPASEFMDGFKDERTQEEKDEEYRRLRREAFQNMKNEALSLKKYTDKKFC